MTKPVTDDSGPRLIPQAHGGTLFAGGVRGNKGGAGRPPSALRERLRGSIEERVQILEEILDDPETSARDKISCAGLLLQYGLGSRFEVEAGYSPTEELDVEALRADILARLPRVEEDEEPRALPRQASEG
jgi:hypothetical protein